MASCWCFSRGCQAENSGSFRRYFFASSPLPSTALIIFHQPLHRLTCMVMSLPWNRTTFILDQPHLSIYLFLKRSICASETGARHQLLPFAPLTANCKRLRPEQGGKFSFVRDTTVEAFSQSHRSHVSQQVSASSQQTLIWNFQFIWREWKKRSFHPERLTTVNAVTGGGVTTPCSVEHSPFCKSNSIIKVWQTWCHLICFFYTAMGGGVRFLSAAGSHCSYTLYFGMA